MIVQILILFAAVFVLRYLNNKQGQPELNVLSWCCIFLQAAFPAAAVGSFIWMTGAPFPETYTDFAGGFLAMASMGKSYEYNAFYCGFLLFIPPRFIAENLCQRVSENSFSHATSAAKVGECIAGSKVKLVQAISTPPPQAVPLLYKQRRSFPFFLSLSLSLLFLILCFYVSS